MGSVSPYQAGQGEPSEDARDRGVSLRYGGTSLPDPDTGGLWETTGSSEPMGPTTSLPPHTGLRSRGRLEWLVSRTDRLDARGKARNGISIGGTRSDKRGAPETYDRTDNSSRRCGMARTIYDRTRHLMPSLRHRSRSRARVPRVHARAGDLEGAARLSAVLRVRGRGGGRVCGRAGEGVARRYAPRRLLVVAFTLAVTFHLPLALPLSIGRRPRAVPVGTARVGPRVHPYLVVPRRSGDGPDAHRRDADDARAAAPDAVPPVARCSSTSW